jgi:hypothetical protein
MSTKKPSVRRVVMSKAVARSWLQKKARPEYRFRVFNPQAKDYPSVLRSFRDGKLALKVGSEKIPPVSDLGVKEDFGGFYVWSSDLDSLKTLQQWFERRGLETSWIW